jgi:hypothetical protein
MCWTCPKNRVKVKPIFNRQDPDYKGPYYCYYKFNFKLIYAGSVIVFAAIFCLVSLKCGCNRVKDIERVYITQNVQQNYVNVANLMNQPNQFNPGAGP